MVTYTYDSEENLSDKDFMVMLYTDFEKLFFYTAYKYTSNREMAEDIVLESLVNLHQKIETIRPMDHAVLAAYVRTTVRNTAINIIKAHGYEKDLRLEDNIKTTSEMQGASLDDLLSLTRYRDLLKKIWPLLSEEERFLLEGKYVLGYKDNELAIKAGCKASSIRMKLTRARRHALTIIVEQEGVKRFDEA